MGLFKKKKKNTNLPQAGSILIKPSEVEKFKDSKTPVTIVNTSTPTSNLNNIPSGNVREAINRKGGGRFSLKPKVESQPQSTLETPTEASTSTQTTKKTLVRINRNGSVRVGDREYRGNARIPDLDNKTANQVQQEAQQEINAERKARGEKAIGRGRFSGRGEIVQTTTQTASPQEDFSEKLFGKGTSAVLSSGSLINNWPELNTSMEGNGLIFDVQPVKQETGIKGLFQRAETKASILETSRQRNNKIGVLGGASLIGLTAVNTIKKDVVGVFNLGKGLITKPVQTIKQIPQGVQQTTKEFITTFNTGSSEKVLGTIIGEGAFFKGMSSSTKLVTKGSDVIRTAGLKEIPKERIIAPEYFAGQRYPKIKSGQTAGELLQEFKSKDYFTGLTASPKSFKKVTTAGAGSSEISGIYQAPKLSPSFLKIAGENKVFSFNPFETLKPTALKITPTSYELVGGVSPYQKSLNSLPSAKLFFKNKAEPGKSYIPFVKTEKEAVIPAGTPLIRTGKEFYFKFEGRRIPIYEYSTTNIKTIKTGKITTAQDVFKSSSYRRLGSRGVITPVELSSVAGKVYSSVTPKVSYKNPISSLRSNPYLYKKISSPYSYSGKSSINNVYSVTSTPSRYKGTSYSSTSRGGSYGKSPIGNIIYPRGLLPRKQVYSQTKSTGSYQVFFRRGGKWLFGGKASSVKGAEMLGKDVVGKTLARSFFITGSGKTPITIPGYRSKVEKVGNIFIEPSRRALSTGSEKREIQASRRMLNSVLGSTGKKRKKGFGLF